MALLKLTNHQPDVFADFRERATLCVAAVASVALLPVSALNVFRREMILGLGTALLVAVLILLAFVAHKGYYSNFSLVVLPPLVSLLAVTIHYKGAIGVMWAYPSIIGYYFLFCEKWAWFANALTLAVAGPVAVATLDTGVAMRAVVTMSMVSLFAVLAMRTIVTQQHRLEQMAVTDPLTGLLNRSLLISSLELAASRHRRTGEPATLLSIDIDHFKLINDTYGHMVGDDVLRGIANILKSRMRATDSVFRVGGEEFMVLLSDTDAEPAHHVAQLLRSAIAGENLIDSHPVTVSIGAATMAPEETTTAWMGRSDRCLYEAKHAGRNTVCADTPLVPARPARSDTRELRATWRALAN